MIRKSFQKPIFAWVAAFTVLFSGCSAASTSSPKSMDTAPTEYAVEEDAKADKSFDTQVLAMDDSVGFTSQEASAANSAPALSQRKIIKHSDLSLETKEFDTALAKLMQLVESAGGYIESQNTNGHSLNHQDDYYSRNAQINARIPADKLDDVTASVGALCNIVSQNDAIDDITDTYFDAQAHLKVLQVQEERLLEILHKAEKLEDVVTLEKALSDVRYQIESLTASIKRMDSQVTYSYLSLYLQEVGEYNTPVNTPKSFSDRLSSTFARSVAHIRNSVQGFLLFIVEVGPVVLFWGIILGVIALIVYRVFIRKKNKAPKPEPQQPEQDSDSQS